MDRRVGKTCTAIRNAYLDILKDSPAGRITVAEIARRANIDRKTFYLHYATTDAVLDEIYDSVVTETIDSMQNNAEDKNKRLSVEDLFDLITAMIAKNLDIFEILAARSDDKTLFEKLRKTLIRQIVTEYKDELGLTETQFHIYAEFFMSGIIASYSMWISGKLPLRIEELAQMVTRASLYGLEGVINNKESEKL